MRIIRSANARKDSRVKFRLIFEFEHQVVGEGNPDKKQLSLHYSHMIRHENVRNLHLVENDSEASALQRFLVNQLFVLPMLIFLHPPKFSARASTKYAPQFASH